MRRVLTTGGVSRLLGLSHSKVNALADSGMLECFRVPNPRNAGGYRHRRFLSREVLKFARENSIPLNTEDEQQ